MHRNDVKSGLVIYLTISMLLIVFSFGGNSPQVRAVAPGAPINLYYHNDTTNPSIVGGAVRTVRTLNTSQAFRILPQNLNNTPSGGIVSLDFYLHPVLANTLILNGTLWLHPWIAGFNTGGSSPHAGFSVSVYDVSPPSTLLTLVGSGTSGSKTLCQGSTPLSACDVNTVAGNTPLIFSIGAHNFAMGDSILVHVDISPGANTQVFFFFDNSFTPSFATLYVQNPVSVAKTWTADSTGTPTTVFTPSGSNLLVLLSANVTDPMGGYDINASKVGSSFAQVALNLTGPTGTQLLTRQRMNLISGGPLSFQNLFRLNYTLTIPFPGQYNFTVIATDNSGNVALGNGSFQIGQVFRLQAEAVDAKNRPLTGATILGKIQGISVFAQATNSSGWIDRVVVSASYNLSVVWRGTVVNETSNYLIAQNTTIILHSAVYDPKFQALDDVSTGLPQAEIFIESPNGTRATFPFFTNAVGFVNLTESQGGSYGLVVLWKGIVVYNDTVSVTSDGPFAFKTEVYQIKIIAQGQDGSKLQGALIAIHSPTSSEIVYSFGLTDSTGTIIFRLPVGNYTVNGYFSTTYLLTAVNTPPVTQGITVTSSHSETLTFQGVPPPLTSTLAFQLGGLFLILLVLAAGVGYFMGKRGKGKSSLKASG